MAFNVNKYVENKKKRNCFDFLKYCYLKNKRKKQKTKSKKRLKQFCIIVGKTIGYLFLFLTAVIMFLKILSWYDDNYKYSIAMPDIVGYFIKHDDGFTANGIYTISAKEKDKGEKSASLLFGTINCYYEEKYCKEELVQIMNIAGIVMYPYVWEYDITYRDKNRVIYGDGYKNSVVVDLNQETITKTIYKTFLQEKPKNQIDEFITNQSEIEKEVKCVIRKHLKKKFW